jgi:hypothetical protein
MAHRYRDDAARQRKSALVTTSLCVARVGRISGTRRPEARFVRNLRPRRRGLCGYEPEVVLELGVAPAVLSDVPCWRSRAAPATQTLNGVPFWPAMCRLLSVRQAVVGLVARVLATFASAVTQAENGVPGWPETCRLLSVAQYLP